MADEQGGAAIVIAIDGRNYVWDGSAWHDEKSFLSPPASVVHTLNGLVGAALASADRQISDPRELIGESCKARNSGQWSRAERLARRALELQPNNCVAATVLSAALRELKRPDEALAVTDAFVGSRSGPLLTTRAAALCDLGDWYEAKRTNSRAFAVSDGKCAEAFAVHRRIKANAPELG